jgi:hypothetical protein
VYPRIEKRLKHIGSSLGILYVTYPKKIGYNYFHIIHKGVSFAKRIRKFTKTKKSCIKFKSMQTHRAKPHGRNVINIQELERILSQFSETKKLSEPITKWLQKNFLKWVINHFSPVQVVQSSERFRSLVRGTVPTWFIPNSKEVEFIYIDPEHPQFQELLEKTSEFLGSRATKETQKFYKMSVDQVLKKWEEEHQRITNRKERHIETSEEALKEVFSFGEFTFVKFINDHKELSLEMARESALMQHCLGEFDNIEQGEGGYGAYYIELIREEKITLFSLRDAQNNPHVTIALYPKKNQLWLDQIKGKQNRYPIERYIPASKAFFNHLGVHHTYHPDCLGMGLIYSQGETKHLNEVTCENEQHFLVAYNPELITHIQNPSAATLWLVHTRKPSLATKLQESSSDAMKISALIQQPILMNKLSFKEKAYVNVKSLLKGVQKYTIGGRLFRFIKLQIGRIV